MHYRSMDQSYGQNDRDENGRDQNDHDESENDRLHDHVRRGDALLSYLTPAHCLHHTTMQEVQSLWH